MGANIILYTGLFSIVLLWMWLISRWRSLKDIVKTIRHRLILSWLLLYIGMGIWIPREGDIYDVTTIDASAIIQVISILVVSFIVFGSIRQLSARYYRLPLICMSLYAGVGIVTSPLTTTFLLNLFKAYSVLLTVVLAALTIRVELKNCHQYVVYNISYVYFGFMCMLAVIGGVFFPDITHRPNNGVFGFMLEGMPKLNSNSLGYMSGIAVVISYARFLRAKKLSSEYPYLLVLIFSTSSLIMAQSRTSIAGTFLGLVFLSFLTRRKAMMRLFILLTLGVVSITAVITSDRGIGQKIVKYLERGVSKEKLETLSGRTLAWEYSWKRFQESPFIGYGFYSTGKTEIAPHSAYFTTLLNVGISGFVPWLVFIAFLFIYIPARGYYFDNDRYQYRHEITAVLILQFLRTVTGQDVTIHSYSTMLMLSIIVSFYVAKRLRRKQMMSPA